MFLPNVCSPSSCKNMVTATKGLTIHRGTNVLILVLKRFDIFTGGKITKVTGTTSSACICAVAKRKHLSFRTKCDINLLFVWSPGSQVSRVLRPVSLYEWSPRKSSGVQTVCCLSPLWTQQPLRPLFLLHQGTCAKKKKEHKPEEPFKPVLLCLTGKQWPVVPNEWQLCDDRWHQVCSDKAGLCPLLH